MSIPLHISPRIIPSIASLYNDTNRIFMEYIDNSLDSADTYFFDKERNVYSMRIEITIKIEGEKFNNGKVIITDNCFGITNFTKVVEDVGNSDKKAQPWTNGQFGYGIYSFMACCSELEITSKLKNNQAFFIPIKKRQFDAEKVEDVHFPDPRPTKFDHDSGTKVVLSKFDKEMWKQIDFNEIRNEIEQHFELLLSRKNLIIKLISADEEYICKPFNYTQFEGEEYEDYLDELSFTKGRKSPQKVKITVDKPIHIFLKITKGKVINKPPVFVVKGRRIADIKDIKLFHSKHKSDIWGHPQITGYIDLSDYLEPTIARNDFKNNNRSRALFNTLEELEPLILDVIKEENEKADEQHYQNLEDELNKALSKLAKIDEMKFRTEYLSGNKVNLQQGGSGQAFEDGFGEKDRGKGKIDNNNGYGWGGEREGEGKGPSGKEGKDIFGGENEGSFASNQKPENPFEDTNFKGGEKKRSGFNIRIVSIDPPTDENGQMLRSQLIGGDIRLFRRHPDFEERVDASRKGEKRVSQRLITYIAGEITVHYKDKLQTKQGQPEYNKSLFVNFVEFIYTFESMIKHISGANLTRFSE